MICGESIWAEIFAGANSGTYGRRGTALTRLSELGSLLLELLDGSLVDTSTFVDQMTGGGRLSKWLAIDVEAGQSGGVPRVDVSNDNDVNVSLLFTHFDILSVSKSI